MNPVRNAPIEMSSDEFKRAGYALVDAIAAFISNIQDKKVTTGETPQQIEQMLDTAALPQEGESATALVLKATDFLINHSLLNGHPKFLGYITSSAAPIGALADLLAAAVNPNVGANILSPMATAIEKQTVKWLAEFIGVPNHYGGLLVSGGNMANFTAFLAARTQKAAKEFKQKGLTENMLVYCSKATHTWVEKAVVLFGHGTDAIRWIDTDNRNKMQTDVLTRQIEADLEKGDKPFMVVGNAGDVSTGAIDDLKILGRICKQYDLWFHIDGAYGIPAAAVPGQKNKFNGMEKADSIALDPHKWLYSPLEAGCTLVKDPNCLTETFSSHPVYYNFSNNEAATTNFYEYGLQNSRGFRALKVWLALQQAGKSGYIKMLEEDIMLSELLYNMASQHRELEAVTQSLSITTLRYIPKGYDELDDSQVAYLNNLNESLLNELQQGGKVFLSNAQIEDKYCLRGCIVNFRTTEKDIEEIIEIIVSEGRRLHAAQQKE